MHVRKKSSKFSYEMRGKLLKVSEEEERDSRDSVHKSAKYSWQYAEASRKANSTKDNHSHYRQGYNRPTMVLQMTV